METVMEEQTIEDRFKFTNKGIVFNISKKASLPGTFMNMLQAERAYEKHLSQTRAAKAEKKKVRV